MNLKNKMHHQFTALFRSTEGFSLIEISIVLIIVGLLLGGLLTPLQVQKEVRDIKTTLQILDDTQLAIFGYAYINSFLPCPDTDGDGQENFAAGNCTALEGDIPWGTIGSAHGDSFRGNRLGYRIDASFNNHTPITCAGGAVIEVCNAPGCAAGTTLTNSAAFLTWSYGKNGYGSTSAQGNLNAVPAGVTLSASEAENNDNDAVFVQGIHINSPSGTVTGFDDLVVFVADSVLCAKMVAAGVL